MASERLPAGDLSAAEHAANGAMRAIVQDRYGSPDMWRLSRVARPNPGEGEVLVRVSAAGLDRGTWHLMTGRPYIMRPALGLRGPRNPIPGRDVAGTVQAVGAGVTRFRAGDEVFGIAPGSFAEYAVAPLGKLARKPASLSFEQAAVLALSASTALQALRDAGRVQPGQRVLIIGASGGVGSYAVQLAKVFEAEVAGVCSTGKLDLVKALGADHVIDYTRDDFAAGRQRYDLILDIGGNASISRLRRALAPAGTAVFVGGEGGGAVTGGFIERQLSGRARSLFGPQRLVGMLARERASDFEQLGELVDAGKLTPSLDRTYPLEQAAEAMRQLEAGKVRGKVAVTI